MTEPKVSVIIPVYNQAKYLPDAVNSILGQSYENFEIVIIDDCSPDNLREVVNTLTDPRIKTIVHRENRGLPASRNSGINVSDGELVALLDADDYYSPDKLAAHVEFHRNHPEIGVTYNSRFNLNHSTTTVREIWRPPARVDLSDLVLGFPFAPSDLMIKRHDIVTAGLYNEAFIYGSEDLEYNCRLALSGSKFACVDQVLNFRRYHASRKFSKLPDRAQAAISALDIVFGDPRLPQSMLSIKERAYFNRYLDWSILCFSQGDTNLGQEYLRAALEIRPSITEGSPCELIIEILNDVAADESLHIESKLQEIVAQFPQGLRHLGQQLQWAIPNGYLLRGTRATIWGRPKDGDVYFAAASSLNAAIDRQFMAKLAYDLFLFSCEFGMESTEEVCALLAPKLRSFTHPREIEALLSRVYSNAAFEYYKKHRYGSAISMLNRVIYNDPKSVLNRGFVKIYLRSIMSELSRRPTR